MTKDELLNWINLYKLEMTDDKHVKAAVDAYTSALLKQCNVSGALPPDQRCKVQRIVNMAMLETGLSEDEVAGYMLYLLKGKEIERRSGNDR